jgi:hypothetical protein
MFHHIVERETKIPDNAKMHPTLNAEATGEEIKSGFLPIGHAWNTVVVISF